MSTSKEDQERKILEMLNWIERETTGIVKALNLIRGFTLALISVAISDGLISCDHNLVKLTPRGEYILKVSNQAKPLRDGVTLTPAHTAILVYMAHVSQALYRMGSSRANIALELVSMGLVNFAEIGKESVIFYITDYGREALRDRYQSWFPEMKEANSSNIGDYI